MIVTVVTPTLNGIEYLAECIASVQRNRTRDIEIDHVIVDGGSTDGTVEMAEAAGLRVMTGKDSGIFDAINKGSFNSEGALLGFLGADDVMLEGAMAEVVRAWRDSGRRWVVGGIRWIDDRGRDLGELAAPPGWMTPRMHVCLGWNPIMHMGTYFSRDFFDELGGFDIAFRDAGDYDLFARALAVAPYARLGRPVACFRRTGHNNSAVNCARSDAEWRRVLERFGPPGAAERRFWRYALKAWFNLANPHWLLWKLSQPARLRLRLQERAYF
ncbi:glycosyltransferase family 2 protein [Paeniroseomonas aquatica]|uniref:Glycosyltransferase family 2 protein n=1 Tax=Paeniroseomonas aquatica TaxID=373043 RepID=A0ABT8AGC1_9PROT|nr:glycosyltransferase family 2 protein [Paeniroseomonas aquatica]MDN3568883.1 glycosyltransferase family 2 protein [Paeniroseomonas aquatica]